MKRKTCQKFLTFGYWSCVTFARSVLKEWTAAVGILKYMWVLNHDGASKINRNRKHQLDLQCKFSTEALRGSENLIFSLQKSIGGKGWEIKSALWETSQNGGHLFHTCVVFPSGLTVFSTISSKSSFWQPHGDYELKENPADLKPSQNQRSQLDELVSYDDDWEPSSTQFLFL